MFFIFPLDLLRGYTFKFVQRAITNNAQLPQFEIQPHDETHLRLQDLESVRQSGVLCIIITGHASPDLLCPCGGVFVRVHHSNKLTFSATISKVVEHGAVNAAISDIVRTSLQCVGGCGGLNCKGNLAVNEIMNLLLKIEAALTQPQLMAAAAQGGGASGAAMFAIRYN